MAKLQRISGVLYGKVRSGEVVAKFIPYSRETYEEYILTKFGSVLIKNRVQVVRTKLMKTIITKI